MGGNISSRGKKNNEKMFGSKNGQKRKKPMRPDEIKKLKFEMISEPRDLERYSNYGLLPNDVIHRILVFLPPPDYLRTILTSRLFWTIGSTVLFWKQYFTSYYKNDKLGKIKLSIYGEGQNNNNNSVNWKREFYKRYNMFSIRDEDYYREKYGQKKNEKKKKKNQKELDEEIQNAVPFKIVLLGETASGKSSLVLKQVRNQFFENHESTIGAAFLTNIISTVKLTLNYEIYIVGYSYYRGASFAFVVFDLTDYESYKGAKGWVKELVRNNMKKEVLLVGTKLDLVQGVENVSRRKVPEVEAWKFANEETQILGYVELSSKTGEGVFRAFGVATEFLEKKIKSEEEEEVFQT